ncbi:MAG: Mrp/NBP35 family ATP-binding protein [Alistipes sp.]|jgi:ATP-binding protein involved in chromosome partitioning|nr:Mrp/NBP35 family ATP-binding protein [Alistipes sp.]MBR5819143.1 Mrp/NBP35 family ATP-binding protein [Alistipes sp.]MEE1149301.1 Mrp/NBP35 family ATP-binding protein [Alistipes sp.]
MNEQLEALLRQIIHPETEQNIVDSGFVDRADMGEDGSVAITLRFQKARDPFAQKVKRQVEELMTKVYPESKCMVIIREAAPKPRRQENVTTTTEITRVIAVASGKGGVGKSTVTANLAVALRQRGYNVGILDADIYGPSQNKMFGCEGYIPDAERDEEGHDFIIPCQSLGIKIMSIGFFIKSTDALMWRGGMAVNALHQLIHQTRWGKLDYLLVDLPPGTGDIHLSIINELKISGAVIVSTPQQVAVADVIRGVEMFRHPQVNIPVLGIVENMAWFTPEELPNNRYYLFGKGGAARYAQESGVDVLGEVPIIQSIMEGSDEGRPAGGYDPRVEEYYAAIAAKIVEKLPAEC